MEDTIESIANVSNILDMSNQLTSNRRPIQKGGQVFNLLFYLVLPFKFVAELIIKILGKLLPSLLAFYIRDEKGNLTLPYTDSNSGLFWKFLYVTLKIGLYLVVFAVGGLGVTVFGMGYLYTKLFSQFTKKKTDINEG